MLPFIDKHPDIRFTVFLPPYHIYTWCLSEYCGDLKGLLAQREEVLLELVKRPNVELYDFQSDPSYVLHHDYFSDVQHFSDTAAKRILQDIASGRRRLTTPAGVRANAKELHQLVSQSMPRYRAHMEKGE